jgi:outer membrane protein assembly factor BamB
MTTRWSGAAAGVLVAAVALMTAGCSSGPPPAPSAVPVVSVTTPRATGHVRLPAISGSGVRVLWQGAPWGDLTFAGAMLLGVNGQQVAAVSAATGAPLWTATIPASLSSILGLVPAGDVVIVEAGHEVGQAPAAVYPVVSEYVALDAVTGKMRWAIPVGGRYQSPPIAASGRFLLTGDPSGAVTGRIAATGRVAWRDRRPRGCGPAPSGGVDNAGLGIATDGALATVSFECGPRVIVQRLDPATGEARWTWRSPAASDSSLSVAVAARDGGLVLVSGQISPSARPFARKLPRARVWPQALGPADDTDLIVALDAATGHPRWSETGGQLETFAPTDGALCEVVNVGLECRGDVTGALTMRTLLTGKGDGDSPPYSADGYAAVSGGLAAVTVHSRHGVVLLVLRVHGGATVTRIRLMIRTRAYGGANYQVFAVAAGPLASHAILVLVRRVDLPGYPVLAIDVT